MPLERPINLATQELISNEPVVQSDAVVPLTGLSSVVIPPVEVQFNHDFTPTFQIDTISRPLPDIVLPAIDLPVVHDIHLQSASIYRDVPDMHRWPETYGYPAIFGGTDDLRELFRNRVSVMMPELGQEELDWIVTNLYRPEWEANDEIRNQKMEEFKRGSETSRELNRLLREINRKQK